MIELAATYQKEKLFKRDRKEHSDECSIIHHQCHHIEETGKKAKIVKFARIG